MIFVLVFCWRCDARNEHAAEGRGFLGLVFLEARVGTKELPILVFPQTLGNIQKAVFYFCVHTRLHSWCLWQDLCGGESWAAAGWVMWPSPGANKACCCFSPLFTFHASLGKGRRIWGGGCCAFEEKPVKKTVLMCGTARLLHGGGLGGGPSTPYQAIPLPHGDDEAVVTTGRCHVPRIFFFSGKRLWFDILPDTWLQRGPDGWAVSFWASGTQCLWKLHLCSWASAVPAQERLWNKKRGKK